MGGALEAVSWHWRIAAAPEVHILKEFSLSAFNTPLAVLVRSALVDNILALVFLCRPVCCHSTDCCFFLHSDVPFIAPTIIQAELYFVDLYNKLKHYVYLQHLYLQVRSYHSCKSCSFTCPPVDLYGSCLSRVLRWQT